MELSIYNIIKESIITSKSLELFKKLGQVTFLVHQTANKIMIKKAVEKIWNVKVDKVRIVNLAGKDKVFARKLYTMPNKKKAIVSLKKGYKIEIPGMIEMMNAPVESPPGLVSKEATVDEES